MPSFLLSCDSSGQHQLTFYFMHNPVFEHSDTLSFALLAYIILHINGKQFRCSVFTFVQYITYTGITDELFSQPLHNINKLGQFMSTNSNTPLLKRAKNMPKFHLITEKHSKNIRLKILSKNTAAFSIRISKSSRENNVKRCT